MKKLSPKLPLPMLASSLRTLIAVIQSKPDHYLLASYPQVAPALAELIKSPSTPASLVDLSCKLIPLLASTDTDYIQCAVYPLIASISNQMRQVISTLSSRGAGTVVPLKSSLLALAHIIQESECIQLLSSSLNSPSGMGKFTINPQEFMESLIILTRHPDQGVRIAAVAALVKITSFSSDSHQIRRLTKPLLPTLVPLLDAEEKDPQVYRTLAIVFRDDAEAVQVAWETGVIEKVAAVVNTADTVNWSNSDLISSCLLVLVAFSMRDEIFRLAVMDTKVMDKVVGFMSSRSENPISMGSLGLRKVQLASCHLLRTLAHSVTLLRTGLATPEIAEGIHSLLSTSPDVVVRTYEQVYGPGTLSDANREYLEQQELEVKSAVMAAVCNIIPESSSLQSFMVEKGFLQLIIEGARSTYGPLRLNSVWALKHAIYEVEAEPRLQLLNEIVPSYLMKLCNDEEPQIQEQALGIIRNIACSGDLVAIVTMLERIRVDNFIQLLNEKLKDAHSALAARDNQNLDHYNQVLIQIVYIICNMSMHTTVLRNLFLQHEEVLRQLLPLFSHPLDEIRSACTWVVINLVWQDASDDYDNDNNKNSGPNISNTNINNNNKTNKEYQFLTSVKPSSPLLPPIKHQQHQFSIMAGGVHSCCSGSSAGCGSTQEQAARTLVDLGFKQKLLANRYDSSLDVRERTKTALAKLDDLLSI